MMQTEKTKTELLTPQETAEYLKVSRQTVYNLLKDDLLPYIRIGGQYRIESGALLESFRHAYGLQEN
ncbi:MAG: helix-turn-helix domain-containing protein [Planctomycetaceae bacterium]|jgi:excisionase family DNA binding protein|nr:helix-turn-helix domain-containing protein [Planctomycetaceae bacterium]